LNETNTIDPALYDNYGSGAAEQILLPLPLRRPDVEDRRTIFTPTLRDSLTRPTPDSSLFNPAPMGSQAPAQFPKDNSFLPKPLFGEPLYPWDSFRQAASTPGENVG
jgi:hypothetical protein